MEAIELLYFQDCPSWRTALDNLRQVIEAEQLPYLVRLVEISTPQQAQSERFLGSPSFRLNGADFWPEPGSPFSMNCRVYRTPQGLRGSPPVEMLRERIRVMRSE